MHLTPKMTAANQEMMKILQINVDRRQVAHDLMVATASQLEADVLIISEPNRIGLEEEGWFSDVGSNAAVVVFNPTLSITEIGPKNNQGFRWIKIGDIRVYACYWSPNTTLDLFIDFIDRLGCSSSSG